MISRGRGLDLRAKIRAVKTILASLPHALAAAGIAGSLAFPPTCAATEPAVLPSVLEPAGTGGLAALDRALAKLTTHRRLLVVGAHPDDEDTSALALVARELGGEAAYLSLSRGEGGQNLIGPELGEALGVLRTQELLAARRIDGARQYFTRAFDFGYTRSLDETWKLWPREALLEDAVRVVRRFKPQVILSVFGDDGSGGHAQHQAAGHTAYAAFRRSAEAATFPGLAAEGLPPWRASVLYRAAWFAPERATVSMPLGGIDPWSGHSILQLAMRSRGEHRSQDMGRLLDLGPRDGKFTWVEGDAGRDGNDLFAGIDTRLPAIAAELAESPLRGELERRLARVEELARGARAQLSVATSSAAFGPLGEALAELEAAESACRPVAACSASGVAGLLAEKRAVAAQALLLAAGVVVDVASDREQLVPGEAVELRTTLWNAGTREVQLLSLGQSGPFELAPPAAAGLAEGPIARGELRTILRSGRVLAEAPPGRPYFLMRPRTAALYDWSGAPAAERGEPLEPAGLVGHLVLAIDGRRIALDRPAVYRYGDQAKGEIRRPLRVVPPLEVVLDRELVLVTPERPEAAVEVRLRSNAASALAGELHSASACPGFAAERRPFALAAKGEASFRFALRGCPTAGMERSSVRFVARLADGREVDLALPLVDYPHIAATPLPVAARVEVVATDLRLPRLGKVGYVLGASDRVPGFLAEVGVPLELLGAETLATGDLARYDAIVVGSRAYETEPALAAHNARLLDYARGGGLVIVQYQQYPFVEGKFAPYPLEIGRPHDRVTDESSSVAVLSPEDPVFNLPNAIGPADWDDWVQERALYMPRRWDPAYRALLEVADPGQTPQRGALLVARLGEGSYVYTGLAFFRELPAGVAGAYRLFANLLTLATPEGRAAADRAAAAHELAQRLLVVDTHIDLPYRLQEKKEDVTTRTGGDFDLPRARAGGLDVAFMSIYVPSSYQKSGGGRELADSLIDGVEALVAASPENWALAPTAAAALENQRAGRISLALGMENGAPVGDDLANLGHFYDRGIRYITLTHGEDNQICDSSYVKPEARTWHGLSPFGREVIAEMNRLGILVDLSHVSDQTFDQAIALVEAPPIASHSSCRHFTPGFERNLDDARIRALAAKGGVIQINFGSSFLTAAANAYSDAYWSAREAFVTERKLDEHAPEVEAWEKEYQSAHPLPRATLEDVVAHIEHVVKLVGVDHVGLGSDFDGVGDSLPTGLKDVSMYPNLFAELLAKGWNEIDLAKLAGGNLMRVWREAEEVAARSRRATR